MHTNSNTSSASLLIQTIDTASGHLIGHITLNHPATLNALSLPIVATLYAQLQSWATDPKIAAVLLDSSSEKAFCAGGDLHMLYKSMQTTQGNYNADAAAFFSTEYSLDYLVHCYPKPIVVWMHGIVMGGGVGLACGARYRIVTESTRVAMPEMHIGLFPDVGGSWFLSRIPARIGRYLALTAARLTAADAIGLGLADLPVPHAHKPAFIASLQQQAWSDDSQQHDQQLRTLISQQVDWSLLKNAPLLDRWSVIAEIANTASPSAMLQTLTKKAATDEWLEPHRHTLAHGSPASALLAWELQDRARNLGLADVFRLEFAAALGCCAYGDLAEGIRALIIEKDKNPRWKIKHLDQVDSHVRTQLIEYLLEQRWPAAHPLQDMEVNIAGII